MSFEDKNPQNDQSILAQLEQGLPAHDDIERRVQAELFGERTLQLLAGQEASPELTEKLTNKIVELAETGTVLGDSEAVYRPLHRAYHSSTPINIVVRSSKLIDEAMTDPSKHPLSYAPFCVLGLTNTSQYPKGAGRRIVKSALGRHTPPTHKVREDLLIDLEKRPWIVMTRTNLGSGDMEWASRKAHNADLNYAITTLDYAAEIEKRIQREFPDASSTE